MKIGIISISPTLTTGFGVTTRYIVDGLVHDNHEVVCFGIGQVGETFNRNEFPCKIWAVGNKNLIDSLNKFLSHEKVDVILINFDILGINKWFKLCRSLGWKGPTISYFVIDGLPVLPRYLDVLKEIDFNVTATNYVARFLREKGFENIFVAPHGVDTSVFKPTVDREMLKKNNGFENKFVIGCFGRNNERKQQPQILKALSLLEKTGKAIDVVLYFHCQTEDDPQLRGWNLKWLAHEYNVEDKVFFPSDDFRQIHGVKLSTNFPSINGEKHLPGFSSDLGYIDRINCCDLVINVPFCGGFELAVIEAQACGVPVVVTNDDSIMREVVESSGFLLSPSHVGTWFTGAKQFFVSPETIADAIIQIRAKDDLKEKLIEAGLENIKRFDWMILQSTINTLLTKISH